MIDWNLPPAPTKVTDTRSVHWSGLGQVELDAVKPENLVDLLEKAIEDIIDHGKRTELREREELERGCFQSELRRFIDEELWKCWVIENFDKAKVNEYPESPQIMQYFFEEIKRVSLDMIAEVRDNLDYDWEEKMLLQRLRIIDSFDNFLTMYADAKEVIFNNFE